MNLLRRWPRVHPALAGAFWCNAALAVLALAAMPFDHRLILGLNPWVKPLKFDVSVMVYLATVAVLLELLGRARPRLRGWIGWMVGVAMIVENTIISLQSWRGVRSHMNYATMLDAMAFAVMGVAIVVSTSATAMLLAAWCRGRPAAVPRAVQWGIRLGLLAFLAGSVEGGLMVVHGAHTVGARDGGAGLALVNWSSSHGDLRVAHFFALHALQAMPLMGWGLSLLRWPSRVQVATLCAGFVLYMGAVWLLFRQAMSGHALLG